MIFPNLPFGHVLWDDANSPDAHTTYTADDIGGVHGSMPILTSGWILKEDADGITVASEYCGANTYRGLTHVRPKMIIEVHHVGHPRPKKKQPPKELDQ